MVTFYSVVPFPDVKAYSHRLKVLDLGNNYLTELPDEIANLGELIHLRLSNNQLHGILPALGQLQCLQVLFCPLS